MAVPVPLAPCMVLLFCTHFASSICYHLHLFPFFRIYKQEGRTCFRWIILLDNIFRRWRRRRCRTAASVISALMCENLNNVSISTIYYIIASRFFLFIRFVLFEYKVYSSCQSGCLCTNLLFAISMVWRKAVKRRTGKMQKIYLHVGFRCFELIYLYITEHLLWLNIFFITYWN